MTTIEFKQKRGLSERHYILYDDKISVNIKTLSRLINFEVRLDKLGFEKNYQADNPLIGKIVFWFCISIPFVFIIARLFGAQIDSATIAINTIIFFFLAGLNYAKQHQDDIFLTGGSTNINFYRKYPDEKSVLDFIDKVVRAAKKYHKDKLLDPKLKLHPDEYLARTFWLHDNKIIDESEFKKLTEFYEIQRLL